MPFLLALLALAGGAYFWIMRARNAADATRELSNVASDVMSAARRFGFRRRHDMHPVDSLEEPAVAIAGIGVAFLELGNLPTAEQHQTLGAAIGRHLNLTTDKAQEAQILGRWLVAECGTSQAGFTRLTKRLNKLQGTPALMPLMSVLRDAVDPSGLGPRQKEALDDIKRQFRLT